uniref:Uncharacterized protein n=1 Tax=Arundo donax TaxID=35708 RepID=A0A0A9F6E6_ARUDO
MIEYMLSRLLTRGTTNWLDEIPPTCELPI